MADTPTTPETAAPNGRPLEELAPPGHSHIAHRVHGWCSKCPDTEVWEELLAWRQRERAALPDAPYTDLAAPLEVSGRG
ncbi:hypothetical protein [Streptomyces sp. 049-1]|uniref:hypothetical protein n=1 Tax=Streptomyces sp. 049-1 TaxID=2789264 RepID=UPI00397FE221